MKKILFAALPVAALALIALQPMIEPLPLGASIPNPELKMKDISGKEVSLKDAKTSKGLLVIFSCNTCPYVIKNQSRAFEVCKFAQDNGVGVAVLNSNEAQRSDDDSYDAMKDYGKDQKFNWFYLVDKNSSLADAFGANRTPECFLFNAEGKLVYHGAIDDNPNDESAVSRKHLIQAMNEMMGGKEVSVKESRSVGCTIKRL